MTYKLTVKIKEPTTNDTLQFNLKCSFFYDGEQYGNGHYVGISGDGFHKRSYDIRYDTSFDRDNKKKWLEQWAKNYWTGKDGSWAIKSLVVEKVES